MVKILNDEALSKILEEATTPLYFFQKEKAKERVEFLKFYEEDGSIIVTFTTGMARIEPDGEDLAGRVWHPPTKDRQGNPILDRQGNPREAWDKFEAKCKINGNEIIYGFGGKNGVLLKAFISEMKKNRILNTNMPNSKWRIKCVDSKSFKWDVEYLGEAEEVRSEIKEQPKEEIKKMITATKEPKVEEESKKAEPDKYSKVVNAVKDIKEKNRGRVLAGLDVDELVEAVSFIAHEDDKVVSGYLPKLEEDGVLKITGNKVYIQ